MLVAAAVAAADAAAAARVPAGLPGCRAAGLPAALKHTRAEVEV